MINKGGVFFQKMVSWGKKKMRTKNKAGEYSQYIIQVKYTNIYINNHVCLLHLRRDLSACPEEGIVVVVNIVWQFYCWNSSLGFVQQFSPFNEPWVIGCFSSFEIGFLHLFLLSQGSCVPSHAVFVVFAMVHVFCLYKTDCINQTHHPINKEPLRP